MNSNEFEMIDLLGEMKEKHGLIEIKAEFEAEGSRIEELMRLKDVTATVGLPIILKIGGAEAVTDIYNGIILGCKGLIAPMVETPYAVSKFLGIIDGLIQPDNREFIDFAINIETITAFENLDAILSLDKISLLKSVTFGRSDFSQSLGRNKNSADSDEIYAYVESTAKKVKDRGLNFALGGSITAASVDFIHRLSRQKIVDKYETRKVVFDISEIDRDPGTGINLALKFELLWLKSKQRFYSKIREEDSVRIADLANRIGITA